MKKYLFYILLPLLAASCDDDDKVVMPDASFTMSADEVSIYETVTYTYTGSPSTQVVIYTGDTGHNFDLKNDGNSGFVVNDGVATYAYKEPGLSHIQLSEPKRHAEIYKTLERVQKNRWRFGGG
ncbi:MAG: hypothetical protein K2L90_07950, partial [Muribaculaceae bacterium]|nr:hypothetical protein [Muribaculaceae bacterium]